MTTSFSTVAPSMTVAPMPTRIRSPSVHPMQRGIVAYSDIAANMQRPASGIIGPIVGNMQYAAILNIGPGPDKNTVHVSANGQPEARQKRHPRE